MGISGVMQLDLVFSKSLPNAHFDNMVIVFLSAVVPKIGRQPLNAT